MFRMQHSAHIAKLYCACALLTISVLASVCLPADTGLRLSSPSAASLPPVVSQPQLAGASSVSGTSTQILSDMSCLEVKASEGINSDEDLKTHVAKHECKAPGLARTLFYDTHALITPFFPPSLTAGTCSAAPRLAAQPKYLQSKAAYSLRSQGSGYVVIHPG
jgi:hypothetical protein